jgi:rRNA maturation RNase YbeY
VNNNHILLKHTVTWGLDEKLVLEKAEIALRKKNLKNVELSVIFVGRKKAKDLNIKYRGKSYIPQVLGFPMDKEVGVDGVIHLGDIVICTQKLKYEVIFQKSTLEKVLFDWLDHGVDNLLM